MAVYCIGDLHGRYDLFMMLLDKIRFDPAQDQLYLLGDVINHNYGGIKIIRYAMAHAEACTLLKGNHEGYFLALEKAYDCIMQDPACKVIFRELSAVYSEPLFRKIETAFSNKLEKKSKADILSDTTIRAWLEEGSGAVRKRLLVAMLALIEYLHYDPDTYHEIHRILRSMTGQYKTKPFVRELLEQDAETYCTIKAFLKASPRTCALRIGDRQFALSHSRYDVNPAIVLQRTDWFPHGNSDNVCYIYGHDPVPLIHRTMNAAHRFEGFSRSCFDFDFRSIFSYIDARGNCCYNLDLGSDPVAALCLNDRKAYYAGTPSARSHALSRTVPEEAAPPCPESYRIAEKAYFCFHSRKVDILFQGKSRKGYAILTYKDGCHEFLIGIHAAKKRILYTRIDYLDYDYLQVIEGWYNGQSPEEVIAKVREDFTVLCCKAEHQHFEHTLRGTLL